MTKGQKVDLTKGNSGLKNIMVGLGWDQAKIKKSGLFSSKVQNVDCDASALLLNANSKLDSKSNVVYFGNLVHKSGSVRHLGDNLTGADAGGVAGDDEQLIIDLSKITSEVQKIIFVVNIYDAVSRSQHFGMVKNAFIRLVDGNTNIELCKYNLSDNYDGITSMIFGEVYRHGDEWKFNAIGEGTSDKGLQDLIKRYS